ncbi:MAG: SPOR domain-containing protein [Deltaproteobacteria bacterium]|nr:SPOR domain-containing protein [Deltaproteobacteria bacterium]
MASKNTRNFEFKLKKQGLVLFILGMSFLLFCVFLFGVMVGKHIEAYPEMVSRGIPDMIRKKLSFKKEKAETEVALRDESGDSGEMDDEEFDLTFYETLAKKKTTRASALRHVKPGAETVKAPTAVPAPGDNGADGKSSAGVVGKANLPGGEKPAEEANGNKSSLVADFGHGEGTGANGEVYIIHAASFREKERSDQLAKKLTALGYSASVITRDLPGKGKWFRVIVSDFKTREEAQKASDAMGAGIRGLKARIMAVDEKKD